MKIFDLEVLKKGYYEGYDPTVNSNVANAFSTAAYRFGHSLVQRSFVRFDSDHRPLFNSKWSPNPCDVIMIICTRSQREISTVCVQAVVE